MTQTVLHGDCFAIMPTLAADSFDSAVTDPPYHLTAGKASAPKGFMGKVWDGGDVAFRPETWAEVFRVLKPGGYLVAFGGPRNSHRMVCAIEDAGFEIRDSISYLHDGGLSGPLLWAFGSGFPKSHDVSKGIDKAAGAVREVVGQLRTNKSDSGGQTYAALGKFQQSRFVDATAPATPEAAAWQGWGTALKPAHEPICLARKPLSERTVAANVLQHGTGAINVDACRVGLSTTGFGRREPGNVSRENYRKGTTVGPKLPVDHGRWPANLIWDGSEEVLKAFAKFGGRPSGSGDKSPHKHADNAVFGKGLGWSPNLSIGGDTGTAARFFYSSKASAEDRVIRDVEEVSIKWISEAGPCQARLQVDTGQSLRRAIVASGSADASKWNTFLFGSEFTDLCRMASSSIISTETSSTTKLKTWNSLTRSIISGCTAGANCEMESGSSLAENAEAFGLSATIMLAATVSLPGVSHALSGTQLRISVSAKRHTHPTTKPVDLMRYLCRLITPPGGHILDPFAGSGTTGMAAMAEGFRATLIEREAEYHADILRRLAHVSGADAPLFAAAD